MNRTLRFFVTCLILGAPCSLCAEAARRPNILVVVADDWSFPHAGIHGSSWVKTPAFDRFAREGVLFSRAYTPVAKCSPSRASLLTGRNPWQLDEAFAHRGFFPLHFRTYAEVLSTHGYFVGHTGKGWAPGVALTATKSPRRLLGRTFDRKTLTPPTTGISRNDYAANFAEFLSEAVAGGSPWCFWLGAIEPHRPYELGSGVAKGGHTLPEVGRLPAYLPEDARVRGDLLDYGLEVEYFDLQLQRVLHILADQGVEENTLVVVTSDNGMSFPRCKGECYDISNHVPLAIRWPEGTPKGGRIVDDYVSLIDLAPTILGAAGIEWASSGMAPATGRSLLPILAAPRGGRVEPGRDYVLIGRERNAPGRPLNQGYPARAIVRDDWLYIENAAPDRWPGGNPETGYLATDTSPTKSAIIQRRRTHGNDPFWNLAFAKRASHELYDLRRDADCVVNRATDPDQRVRIEGLQSVLKTALSEQGDPRQLGRTNYFDSFPFSHPPYNDFYERWQAGQAKIPENIPLSDIEPQLLKPSNPQHQPR